MILNVVRNSKNIIYTHLFIRSASQGFSRSNSAISSGLRKVNNITKLLLGRSKIYNFLSFLFLPCVPKISIHQTRPNRLVNLLTTRKGIIQLQKNLLPFCWQKSTRFLVTNLGTHMTLWFLMIKFLWKPLYFWKKVNFFLGHPVPLKFGHIIW